MKINTSQAHNDIRDTGIGRVMQPSHGVHYCFYCPTITMHGTLTILQCQHIRSLDEFFDGIQMDPVEIAVVGCGCSVATEPVAEISHRWNIPQVCKHDIISVLLKHYRKQTIVQKCGIFD